MPIILMPVTYTISEGEQAVINRLRSVGCAVTVFLPQELQDSVPQYVEDHMCIAGWDVINSENSPD